MRGEFATRVEAALSALWAQAAPSIPEWLPMRYIDWLPTLYEVAGTFRAARRGRSNLYLVLLDFADRRRGPYGLYVGMSRYTPAARFDQHKAGIRAAGSAPSAAWRCSPDRRCTCRAWRAPKRRASRRSSRRRWRMPASWWRAATEVSCRLNGCGRVRGRLATGPWARRGPLMFADRSRLITLGAMLWLLGSLLPGCTCGRRPGLWSPWSVRAPASASSICSMPR